MNTYFYGHLIRLAHTLQNSLFLLLFPVCFSLAPTLQVQEEDYFCQGTHRIWDALLHDIMEAHKDDTDSVPDGSNSLKLIKDAKRVMAVPGSYLDVFTALMCTQLQVRYKKLSEQERMVLKNIMKSLRHTKIHR